MKYSYGELIILQEDIKRHMTRTREGDRVFRQYEVITQLIDNVFSGLETEDDETISEWATATFGEVKNNISIATRANKEMAELLHLLAICDTDPKAAEEAADVVIVLCRLFTRLKTRLQAQVDAKMKINRGREWTVDGSGHGQHVPHVHDNGCGGTGCPEGQ